MLELAEEMYLKTPLFSSANYTSIDEFVALENDSFSGSSTLTEREVQDKMSESIALLNEGKFEEAYHILSELLKHPFPVRDLNYLFAACCLKLQDINSMSNARILLQNELELFPENSAAQDLLAQLDSLLTDDLEATGDTAVQELISEIMPYSMLSRSSLAALYSLAKQVCETSIPGSIVDCGVAGGGSSVLLGTLIRDYSAIERILYACDSFEGIPAPVSDDAFYGVCARNLGWEPGDCAVSQEKFTELAREKNVVQFICPIKGDFASSLSEARLKIRRVAFLHIDCFLYQSVRSILESLYDLVIPGAPIQISSYRQWDGVRKAVSEFEQRLGLSFSLEIIDDYSVWFPKPGL